MMAYCGDKCKERDRRFHVHECQPGDVIKQVRSDAAPEVTFVSDDSSQESGLELISGRALSNTQGTTTLVIEKARIEKSLLD